ncbi:putative fork head protein like protein [Amylocarpus encephaloides]|uniref:Fork head protein like protein n=1 Tax=Amylocarpus encephaloides TaxID=45428 RepID=A0A9P7YQV9_9HELO|nr:putative fork head protein like protein [Amylocarpus encephaloides]
MPPSKRSSRRETVNSTLDIPHSSPSHPTKRRKKAEQPTEQPAEPCALEPDPEPVKLPVDRAGINMNDEELIGAVVTHLLLPEHHVQASQEHANVLYREHNRAGVQAYAKLAGKDWTFYVRSLNNVIGRPPEGATPKTPSGLLGQVEEEDGVHVDLGPNKMVSRLHAEIYFNSEYESWNIHVKGRNGIRINEKTCRRGEKIELESGQVIEAGGVEMMFVLPREGSLRIDNAYLLRAGLIQAPEEEDKGDETEAPNSSQTLSVPGPRGQSGSGPQPIAPAPPDYQRPGTPVGARSKSQYSIGKSPGFSGGTMLMTSDDVDLSLDSNQHIKPSYSYAQMISQAIFDTESEQLNLSGIYTFIQDKYAYYRHQQGGGWQNSIRHNLSLNKAFHKIARSSDEPGKGMKWCIMPEVRDEMAKNCQRGGRGGHRGSSGPNSPANFGYLSSNRGKRRSPKSKSPTTISFPSNIPQFTPDRGGPPAQEDVPGDGSPLPRHRRNNGAFGMSSNAPGSPPVLSSSYLQEEIGSMVTPAPSRVHPRLVPPSTAQRPSQHMPTSSPAPFWKYADIGTPMKAPDFDISPIKGLGAGIPLSSSPPPRQSSAASPTQNGEPVGTEMPVEEEPEEEGGFDLSRGFQSIGSYHAPNNNLVSANHTSSLVGDP